MSKRPAQAALSKPHKRQKLGEPADAGVEQITSARQLQHLLTFQQDAAGQLRTGKDFPQIQNIVADKDQVSSRSSYFSSPSSTHKTDLAP